MVCNQKYIDCVAAPASCTRLYATCPTRPGAGWRGGCITHASLDSEARGGRRHSPANSPLWGRVVTCGAEYGSGGGERRDLGTQSPPLCGTVPTELGTLTKLTSLCVRPAPPPHLAMWGQLLPMGEHGGKG